MTRSDVARSSGGRRFSLVVALFSAFTSAVLGAQLTVSWTDNSTNETGFKIERSTNGSAFTQIGTVSGNTTQFVDSAIAASTTYSYRVQAYNSTSSSAYSNLATVTTSSTSTITSTSTTTATTRDHGRIARVSARAVGGSTASHAMILDFNVADASKSILLRGIGPGLSSMTSSTVMPDPRLYVYDGSTQIASNDNWGGTSTLWAAFNLTGAFPLVGYSKDAALVRSFSTKAFSAIVKGDTSGLALAEIFDADSATIPAGRLSKVFARGWVGTGSGILVVGFTVKGNSNAHLLIRAIGPSLANVSGVLQDPKLSLYQSSTLLRSNDNWGGSSTLAATFVKAGASALSTTSKDSAIDITLNPGTYSATVSGVSSTAGVCRVEIYEIR